MEDKITNKQVEVTNRSSALYRRKYPVIEETETYVTVRNWNGDRMHFSKKEVKTVR